MAAGSSTTPSIPPWATLASGATSGAVSCLLLQPMDFLKTRMQQDVSLQRQHGFAHSSSPSSHEAESSRRGPRKRTIRLMGTIRTVLQEDGWRGLWRGTIPTVARNVPGVALYFYSVSEIRALVSRAEIPYLALPPSSIAASATKYPTNLTRTSSAKTSTLANLTIAGNLVAGAVARVAVGFLLSPVTVVKARFESSHFSKDAYPSLRRALLQIYTNEGVKGLFRGFSATAMRDAPYAGIYLASYEKCKHALGRWELAGGRGSGSTLVITCSGLFAGALATLVTHPFDIIKTRMQTSPVAADRSLRPASMFFTGREIIRVDGLGAYLDGLGLRCARKAASSAIGWSIFEAGRRLWLRTEMERRQVRQDVVRSG